MTTETTRTPQVGETWRHKHNPHYTIEVRYVDDVGVYGLDEVGVADALPASNFGRWEPVPPSRPSIDFTRLVSGVAPGVHVWSDEDGNLHAEWID